MKAEVEKMFLIYVNDFLSVEYFAEYFSLEMPYARKLIKIGRKLNDRRVKNV